MDCSAVIFIFFIHISEVALRLTQNHSRLENKIVGGDIADLNNFPYAAFLNVHCDGSWICGSSILNQDFVVTAAHCLEGCKNDAIIYVFVGNGEIYQGIKYKAESWRIHMYFNSNTVANDIAIVKLSRSLKLGSKVSKIAILPETPTDKEAVVCGWGLIEEIEHIQSKYLNFARQALWTRDECFRVFTTLPDNIICGRPETNDGYAALGDSGSALVVRGYIQVGIVSFKNPMLSNELAVYTEISKFSNWLNEIAKELNCDNE